MTRRTWRLWRWPWRIVAVAECHLCGALTSADASDANERRPKGSRWASQQFYEVEARREAVLPWAAPRKQTFRVAAVEHRKVVKRLERDGYETRARKLKRGTV